MPWQFWKYHIRKKKQETELTVYWEETMRLRQYHVSRLCSQTEPKPKVVTSSHNSLSLASFSCTPSLCLYLSVSLFPSLSFSLVSRSPTLASWVCKFTWISLALSCLLFTLPLNSFWWHKTRTWSLELQALWQHLYQFSSVWGFLSPAPHDLSSTWYYSSCW